MHFILDKLVFRSAVAWSQFYSELKGVPVCWSNGDATEHHDVVFTSTDTCRIAGKAYKMDEKGLDVTEPYNMVSSQSIIWLIPLELAA